MAGYIPLLAAYPRGWTYAVLKRSLPSKTEQSQKTGSKCSLQRRSVLEHDTKRFSQPDPGFQSVDIETV